MSRRYLYFYHGFTYLQGPKGFPTWYSGVADMAMPVTDDASFQALRVVIANAAAGQRPDPNKIVVQACTPLDSPGTTAPGLS